MVIKGGARAEADKLAAHLLRVDTNERVDVRELLGVCAPDLTAALLEMEAIASAARSRRPFYHASINTAPNELMTDAQKARAIDRLEQELGLTGQPRVVVEHVKEGREHLHIAWSRIDGETLCAVPDSHNFRRHEIVARELEREFAHVRVQGAHHERDGVERPARRPSHAEMMQADRSPMTPEQAKAQLRELWRSADTGQAFAAALDQAGWMLAQGDRRGFVALDPTGEVRSVNKDITGLSASKVRERLADLDPDRLPSVDEARSRIRERELVPALEIERTEAVPEPEQAPETSQQPAMQAKDPQPEPAAVHQAERDEAGELAAYAERQRQGFEEAQRLRAGFETAEAACRQQSAETSPQAVLQSSREAGPSVSRPEVLEDRIAALLRELDERLRAPLTPSLVRVPDLQPVQEPEAERVRERTRTPEPPAPTPEPTRPSLFQMLTMGVRAWWQGLHQAQQPERNAERQHDAGDDRQAAPVSMPARAPASEPVRQQEPVRQPAPEPELSRPAERIRRSIADEWLAEARVELAAERARETPEQRADRERQEAERSRGRSDGSRERSRYHHAQLWELLHPFQHGQKTRRRHWQP